MGFEAVANTGPQLHLHELSATKALKILRTCTTTEIDKELQKYNVSSTLQLFHANSDNISYLYFKHNIGIGEASGIALCMKEKIGIFLTDDLGARAAATAEGLEVHGTIGILLRAFRTKIFSKQHTLELLRQIPKKSTLFITERILKSAISAMQDYTE